MMKAAPPNPPAKQAQGAETTHVHLLLLISRQGLLIGFIGIVVEVQRLNMAPELDETLSCERLREGLATTKSWPTKQGRSPIQNPFS